MLGYASTGERLHEVCAARLLRAEQESGARDAVLLSGLSRGRQQATSEAELMARSWNGQHRWMFLDRSARSTYGNVVGVAELARRLNVSEVLLVTSGWHTRRVTALLTWALDGTGATFSLATTDERGTPWVRLRELMYHGATRALVRSGRAWPGSAEVAGRSNDISLVAHGSSDVAA